MCLEKVLMLLFIIDRQVLCQYVPKQHTDVLTVRNGQLMVSKLVLRMSPGRWLLIVWTS